MLTNLITWLALGTCFGLVACVYSVILTEPEMLLNPWYNWLDKKLGPGSRRKVIEATPTVSATYGPARAMWLYKPLVGCPRCVAGQAGAWLFLLTWRTEGVPYSFFGHLLATAASIFAVTLFQKAYKWSRK